MSEASRDLGDTGERHLEDNSNQDVRRSPIRFLPARKCDWTISMPKELANRADRSKKHRVELRYELGMLWRRYVGDGAFSVSMRMLDELYSGHFRKTLKAILDDVATPVRNHSNYPRSARSRSYEFNYRRPKKAPTYNGVPPGPGDLPRPRPDLVRITIPAAWLWDRYERWWKICKRHDWTPNLDLDGRSDWGRPLFAGLEAATIPDVPETERLIKRGVVKAVVRKHGRCYHPLTNLRKDLRRESLFDDEPTAEVDVHACYSCLLVSQLPDGDGKNRAIKALQTDWYAQFNDAYAEWFNAQCAMGKGYRDETGQWMIRQDDDPANDVPASIKVEFQRQCLFWRDGRDASNPVRLTLRRLHPELCQLIEGWRRRMTPTELSRVLTRAEGSLVVDYAMSELERTGIVAMPIHDAVVVPVSQSDAAKAILLSVCEWHLGFSPRVSIKATESITAAM